MDPGAVILAEDQSLLVADKPSGLLTVAAPRKPGRNLTDVLAATLAARGRGERVFPVHRLDQETSGTTVFAKTDAVRTALLELFESHDLTRIYHALVIGRPEPAAGTIVSFLAVGPDDVVRSNVRGRGERATTHYRVVATSGPYTLVECELTTGKRNQIRVHLADRGWPLAGDRKYGVFHGAKKALSRRAPRCMLHATALSFAHPAGGGRVAVVAPFPADFATFVEPEWARELLATVARRIRAGSTP
jgi:23S rRNA pseudouridine1911/1915/1917 synthase